MKSNKILIILIFLLGILTLNVVSADENTTISDDGTQGETVQVQEIEKISNYSYNTEIPEGDVSLCYMRLDDMPKDASGNISMSIDGVEKYNKYVTPGMHFLNLENITFGAHTGQIKYSGDEKYAGFTRNSTFNYLPVIINVPDEVQIGGYDTIRVTVAEGVTGEIKIVLDGKTVFKRAISMDDLNEDCDTGEFYYEYSLDELSMKDHTYSVTYSKGNQDSVKKSGTFKTTYLFDVENKDNITYGESVEFKIELPYDANSKLTLQLNGKTYSVELEDGEGEITLSDFNLGENNVMFTYKDNTFPQKTVTKTVNVLPNLTIPHETYYHDNSKIILKVPVALNGTMTALINERKYQSEIINGTSTISLDDLEPGKYDVELSSDYITANYTLTVNPNFRLPTKIFNGETYNLTFIAPESYNGTLVLTGMIEDNVTVINGSAIIPISNMEVGLHQLNVNYIENNTVLHKWMFNTEFSNVSPDWDMKINLPNQINCDEGYWVSGSIGNVPEEMGGNFKIYVDNELEYILDSEEVREYPFVDDLSELKVGKHNFTVVYSGDGYFKPISKTQLVEVEEVTIKMNPTNDTIIIVVPSDDTGTITVNVDGSKFETINIEPNDFYECTKYDVPLKEFKTQSVEVNYSGKYGTITKQMTVTPDYLLEIIEEYEGYYGEYYLTIIASSKLTKNVTVYVDGAVYDSFSPKDIDEDFDGYSLDLCNLTPEKHVITATYPGDDKYPSRSVNSTIYIMAQMENPYWVYYNDTETVNLTLPHDAKGRLNLYIQDENGTYNLFDSCEVENGYGKVKLPTSKIGEFKYKISFEGNYLVEELEDILQVRMFLNYPYEMTWGDDEYITLKVPNTENGYLAVRSFSDEDFYEVRFNGSEVKIPLSTLDIGDYSEGYLIAFYYDNGKLIDYDYMDIYVNPIPAKLIGGENINMYYCDGSTYSLKIWGDYGEIVGAGEIVTFEVGKNTYDVKTDENGMATLKITDKPGKYTIMASYHDVTVKNKLKIKQVLTLKKVKVKKSAKKLVLTATLKNGKKALKGKKITFKFNGKKFTAKTNKKGIAKVTVKKSFLKKLEAGKKLTYSATYIKDTVKKTVKILK